MLSHITFKKSVKLYTTGCKRYCGVEEEIWTCCIMGAGGGGGYIFFETLELLKRGGLYFIFVF